MATQDPMAPITRLSSLAFGDQNSNYKALYPPILSQEEVIAIPVTDQLFGAIVFDKDTEELETYTAAGFWVPILTEGSDINVNNITAELADLDTINSRIINNSQVITTLGLLVQGDAQINGDLHINSDLFVQNGTVNFANGGVSGNFGVNGDLTSGNLATTGNFLVDGETELQDTTITGDLTVTGTAFCNDYSGAIMDVNDFEANTARIDSLIYGQTLNPSGTSPITVALSSGAGTGATAVITGSNIGGTIRINTGSTPVLGIIGTFTLPVGLAPYLTANWSILLQPGSSTTALYETTSNIYVTVGSGSNQFFIGSSAIALAASTSYFWNYILVGNILAT